MIELKLDNKMGGEAPNSQTPEQTNTAASEARSENASEQGESKEESSEPTTKVPDFIGTIKVKFPDTEQEAEFVPVKTTRGKEELRWAYPTPCPTVRKDRDEAAALAEYARLLGLPNTLEAIEETINRTCQNKWRQVVDSETDPAKYNEAFSENFHAGKDRTAGAITPEGCMRKYNQLQKEFMDEKKANGVTDKLRAIAAEMKACQAKAQELMQAELLKLNSELPS